MDTQWEVFYYEVEMFKATCGLSRNDFQAWFSRHVNNAIAESFLLHTRILMDILMSKESKYKNDIRLKELLPNFTPTRLQELLDLYGDTNTEGTPCWTINKYLAHPTKLRTDNHDYTDIIEGLRPVLQQCVDEVIQEHQRIDGITKRPEPTCFESLLTVTNLTTSSS